VEATTLTERQKMALKGKVLHVGSGGTSLPEWCGKCDEVRLDIDPGCNPDIVGDIRNLGEIGKFDVILSSHVIEHLYEHELAQVFSEFQRVLNDDGVMIMFVPDLEGIKATDEIVYISYFGTPVTGLDMIYGMTDAIKDMPFMAHHTGFTKDRLEKVLSAAGFVDVSVTRHPYNLMGVGRKAK